MKKLIAVLLFLIFAFPLSASPVKAQNNIDYLRVSTENAPVYYDQACLELICFLPKTYFVRLLEETETAFHIEFGAQNLPKIDGFVPKKYLTVSPLEDYSSAYPLVTLTTKDTAVLYADFTLDTALLYLFKNRSMQYYGFYRHEDGTFSYFVSYNGKLGFVKEESLFAFTIPEHPNSAPTQLTPPPQPEQEKKENSPNDFFGIKIAVYACLALAGIIALVVALKPKKQKDKTAYYDENEYE